MLKIFFKFSLILTIFTGVLAKISDDSIEVKHRVPRWVIMTPEYSALGGNPMFWWSTWIKFFLGLYLAAAYAQFSHHSKQVRIYQLVYIRRSLV